MSIISHPHYKTLRLIQHPLVSSKLSLLRDKTTDHKLFRELIYEITLMLGIEATKRLPLKEQTIQTPMESCTAYFLKDPLPVILPILRAGIGMVEALLTLMPAAKVGHIGLFRNEITFLPEKYYFKVPEDCEQRHFFICDPMLATGGSAIRAVDMLKEQKVKHISFICILAAPEGVETFSKKHPDVEIYLASLDRQLNDQCFILPGLGDAGDRLFGTH